MTAKGAQISVLITERIFKYALVPLELILRTHGINPDWPYLHEQFVSNGEVIHRYIQPPRPLKGNLLDEK